MIEGGYWKGNKTGEGLVCSNDRMKIDQSVESGWIDAECIEKLQSNFDV